MIIKTYRELIRISSFIGRYDYLKMGGVVGEDTFGADRYLNQIFYNSGEWLRVRDKVIARDLGRDLGVEGYEIQKYIIVHHINPITKEDIINRSDRLFNLNFLISTSSNTHKAIHFGDKNLLITEPTIRTRNDTCPWRR